MKNLTTIAAIGAVAFTFQTAKATLLFSDNFDSYSTGNVTSSDVNPNNSTGWTQAGNASYLNIVSGGLTYAGLQSSSSGNMLSIANNATAADTVVNTFANQTSGTIYYSFLFDPTVVDSANDYFTALNPGTTAPGGSADALDAYYYSNGKVEVRGAAQSAQAGTGTALSINTTYLIVEEINLTAGTASLWIDPSSSTFGGSAPTATANLSGLTATAIDDIGFKAQVTTTGAYYVDDLLVGTTWADVTPAASPEPSVLALAGAGLGLVSLIRIRRRS